MVTLKKSSRIESHYTISNSLVVFPAYFTGDLYFAVFVGLDTERTQVTVNRSEIGGAISGVQV